MAPIYSKVDGSDPYCLESHNVLSAAKKSSFHPLPSAHCLCSCGSTNAQGTKSTEINGDKRKLQVGWSSNSMAAEMCRAPWERPAWFQPVSHVVKTGHSTGKKELWRVRPLDSTEVKRLAIFTSITLEIDSPHYIPCSLSAIKSYCFRRWCTKERWEMQVKHGTLLCLLCLPAQWQRKCRGEWGMACYGNRAPASSSEGDCKLFLSST